jgi:macrophage erythroblast attacher
MRTGRQCVEAMQHAKKYLSPHNDTQPREIQRAAGLLAFPPDNNTEPYKVRIIPPMIRCISVRM